VGTQKEFSIAQATVADISTGHHRVKKFGIINMAASLGFVFGPIIGGKLADPQLVSWFGDDTPFWFAGVLILCTWILVLWQLPETKPVEARSKPKDSLHPLSGLMIVHKNFTKTGHRDLYLINFLFYFGLFFFYQYYPVLLVKRYSFTPSGIADISAYVAVIVALSQLLIVHPLAKRVHPRKAAILGAFILAPALGCLTIPNFAIVTYIFFTYRLYRHGPCDYKLAKLGCSQCFRRSNRRSFRCKLFYADSRRNYNECSGRILSRIFHYFTASGGRRSRRLLSCYGNLDLYPRRGRKRRRLPFLISTYFWIIK